MRPGRLLVVSIAALLASATLLNAVTERHMLWIDEIGTQLVWRDSEALAFIEVRNSGWHGGRVEWLLQIVKNILGGQTGIMDRRTDLVVLRYANGEVNRTVLKGMSISALQQMDGNLYAKVDDVIMKWDGASFARVPGSERDRLFSGHLRLGDYDEVGGWSVRTNVLAWGGDGRCIPMTVDGRALQLCQHAKMLRVQKELTLGPAGGDKRVIWSLDSTGREVSAQEYDAAVQR